MDDIDAYAVCKSYPWYKQRWWLKVCKCAFVQQCVFVQHSCNKFYVPWYAWPLEIIYRLIFGKVTLEK